MSTQQRSHKLSVSVFVEQIEAIVIDDEAIVPTIANATCMMLLPPYPIFQWFNRLKEEEEEDSGKHCR